MLQFPCRAGTLVEPLLAGAGPAKFIYLRKFN
jgi:hypothetical protein